ncbi:hypothetical protein M404DRAFT_997146 [Pisolithus tinctorius Marx 270]|uniref:Uncharacterized protein n=1 Tax=Pisolithus tinctorius Marx 270 TaxID=870435 RepID=A0A0C3KF50_PISTI|nr:hypothetical protein M404DRAFT_997146 [Pisolithus tinctorius Marx 270]
MVASPALGEPDLRTLTAARERIHSLIKERKTLAARPRTNKAGSSAPGCVGGCAGEGGDGDETLDCKRMWRKPGESHT